MSLVQINLPDLKEWLDKETQGYDSDDEFPLYRKIQGYCKALNPLYGWNVVNFHTKQAEQELSIFYYSRTIFEVEDKGKHLIDNADTREKKQIGDLWQYKSKGKGLFLMAEKVRDGMTTAEQVNEVINM